jgi:hypothetical protein
VTTTTSTSKRTSKRTTSKRSSAAAQTTSAVPANDAPTEFEWVDWRTLRPWPGNPKSYSADEVAELAESVKQNGWGRPAVCNRYPGLEGEIIEGHRSRLAAELLGDGVALGAPGPGLMPVRWVRLPPKRAHALALAATRIPKSELDDDKLKELVRSHELDPLDWLTAGFEESEVRALMFDPWPESKPGKKGGKAGEGLSYQIIIECADEQQQTDLLERFETEGVAAKPWVG